MKDHTLLQAICRTNRTYDQGKTHGLIVDYIGIFDDVAKALDFDENSMRRIITNIEDIKKKLPILLKKCLQYFIGVDRTVEGWEGLMAAQNCLPTNKEKDAFAADYRVLNRAWDALSPDYFLNAFKEDYPDSGYGGAFYKWVFSDNPQPYNSYGNGAAMRVSMASLLGNDESVRHGHMG